MPNGSLRRKNLIKYVAFQINEAFSVQTLACAEALGLDLEKLNVNGGAIALGHPLAASGARITGHLVHELKYVFWHDILPGS